MEGGKVNGEWSAGVEKSRVRQEYGQRLAGVLVIKKLDCHFQTNLAVLCLRMFLTFNRPWINICYCPEETFHKHHVPGREKW